MIVNRPIRPAVPSRITLCSAVIVVAVILCAAARAFAYPDLWPLIAIGAAAIIVATSCERSAPRLGLIAASLLIFAAKLVLVAQNEIVSVRSDAWAYVAMADTDAPWSTLGPSPGYPIWLWFTMHFGLPQRVAIELLFFCASVLFALGTGKRTVGTLGYCLVLTCTVFSPASFYLFDQALSDGMFAACTLAALGLIGFLLTSNRRRPHWVTLIGLGLVLGVMEITRKESALVALGMLMLWLALALRALASTRMRTRRALGEAFVATVVVGAATSTVVGVILIAHHKTEQVWSMSLSELPSHTGMLSRLAAIDTHRPAIRFVPISHEALRLAYRNSPTLARFQSSVENPDNPYRRESERVLRLPGEIGAGWIWHVFNAAAPSLGIVKARDLDDTYAKVNQELDVAFAADSLHKRFVLHPILGAEPGVWLPFIPAGITHVLEGMRTSDISTADANFASVLFDRVCLRRTSLLPASHAVMRGWAFAESGKAVSVFISVQDGPESEAQQIVAASSPRPDVQKAFATSGKAVRLDAGFVANVQRAAASAYQIEFEVEHVRYRSTLPVTVDKVRTLAAGPSDRIVYAIDVMPDLATRQIKAWRLQIMDQAIDAYAGALAWWIIPPALLAALVLSIVRIGRGDRTQWAPLLVLLSLSGWCVARLTLYAVIDAAAWGAEPRYVEVAGMIAMSSFVIAASTLVAAAAVRLGPRLTF